MDRFFSKLDLRDIKIDPEAKFPPTEEQYVEPEETVEPAYTNGADDQSDVVELDAAPVAVEAEEAVSERNGEVLKVSARSRPSAVAGAIAGVVRECGRAEVQAIGAGATNQAVKAVAIARDYLLETGIEAICLPAFIDVTIDNEDRTAIRMIVEPR
jgi:stage V sporulation protein S